MNKRTGRAAKNTTTSSSDNTPRQIPDIFRVKKLPVLSVLLGFFESTLIYLAFLQRHFFSYTYLLTAVVLWVIFCVLNALLISKLLRRRFLSIDIRARRFAVLFSVVVSFLLLFNTTLHPVYYWLPDSTLDITIPYQDTGNDSKEIVLKWIKTGQGFVHPSNMVISGDWVRENDQVILKADQDLWIQWIGKLGNFIEIVFSESGFDQDVIISLNGRTETFSIDNRRVPEIFIRLDNSLSIPTRLPYGISFLISVSFCVFSLLMLISGPGFSRNTSKEKNNLYWLLYALPMLLVWAFSLLVFWPGALSKDSLEFWAQAVSGNFNDWQSALYAIGLSFLFKVSQSPALPVILQITAFSFLVAWGLKTLGAAGVPRVVLWLISLAFALSPINNMLLITLWKDIPYAFAFLLLTVFLLQIFFSHGSWLRKPAHWISLGLVGFTIAILRQNGWPVVIISLAVLPFIYKKHLLHTIGSIVLMAALFFLAKGPLYSAFNVDRSRSGQVNMIFLHHIAAHLDAGSAFSQTELDFLGKFLPLEKWDYSCCYMGNVYFESGFKQDQFLSNTDKNLALAVRLFIQDPLVDVKHTLCSGELAWKFCNTQCYMKSTHGFYSWSAEQSGWIEENGFGLDESSVFPGIIKDYKAVLRYFGFLDDDLVFYLRPAFYFYLLLIVLGGVCLRLRNYKILIIAIPMILQTLLLFLINFAPVYRYFYSTYLIGLWMIGLLFLPVSDQQNPELMH